MTDRFFFTRNAHGRVTAISRDVPAKGGGIWRTLDAPEDGTPYAVHGPFLREDLPADALAMLEEME